MEENKLFQENAPTILENVKKPTHAPSLVLGILAIIFGILFALAGDILGIIGIALAIVKRKDYNTKAGLICSIIGLVIAIANHIVTAILLPQIMAQIGL